MPPYLQDLGREKKIYAVLKRLEKTHPRKQKLKNSAENGQHSSMDAFFTS